MPKGTLQIKYDKLVLDNLGLKGRIKELKIDGGKQATKICVLDLRIKELELAKTIGIQACDLLRDRIEELETELEKHRWIPVSERLPKNIADVFILTDESSGGIAMYGEDEKGVYGWERLDYAINLNITHWKPITVLESK